MEIPTMLPPTGGADSLPAPATELGDGNDLGREDFLLMLVTQLKNQDPLSPMDGQEFAAQLAQFSSLEQLLNLNKTLSGQGEIMALMAESMGDSLGAQAEMLSRLSDGLNRSSATSMIGTQIDVASNDLRWTGSGDLPLTFDLAAPASTIAVTVRDANGAVVGSLTVEGMDEGRHELSWDGLDADGNPLPEGLYTFDVQALDAEGQSIPTRPVVTGIVERVSFGPSGVLVWVNGTPIPYEAITSVGLPTDDHGTP